MTDRRDAPDVMAEIKRGMELDCERLRTHIEQLMKDRTLIRDEFRHLIDLQRNLLVQLKSDTLAGEGQLHTFQVEKRRVEDRLEQLEEQLAEKNEAILELDAKASEYLLKVTTDNNTLYDDENSEEIEADRDLIKQLVYDDMVENNDFSDAPNDESLSNEQSEAESVSSDKVSRSETPSASEFDSRMKSLSLGSDSSENIDDTSMSLDKSNLLDYSQAEEPFSEDIQVVFDNHQRDPAQEQILSLSNLLEELKNVKDEMGKCVSVKDSSMNDLEHELQNTKDELAVLKDSMQILVRDLKVNDEVAAPAKKEAEKRPLSDISEVQEIKEICNAIQEEKEDLIHKMGSLKETMSEIKDHSRSLDRRSHSHSGELHLASLRSATGRSSSTCSVSGKVALLERELGEANDKLNESTFHMKLLVKERGHKQRECDLLQRKVTKVESKMCELQTTFDTLMRAVMIERDELVKELDEKKAAKSQEPETCDSTEVEKLKSQLSSIHEDYRQQLNAMEEEKAKIECEKNQLKEVSVDSHSSETNQTSINDLHETIENKQTTELKEALHEKESTIRKLQERVCNFEMERADFATVLKGEMERLKEEAQKEKDGKAKVESVFASLQAEQIDLLEAHEGFKARLADITKDNKNKSDGMEALQIQINEHKQQIEDHKTKNAILASEMKSSREELTDELLAREGTIQELKVTVTKNQKQSKENYQMIQDDMSVLQIRLNKEREEYDAVVAHLKDKCVKLEEDGLQMEQNCVQLRNELQQATEQTSATATLKEPDDGVDKNTFVTDATDGEANFDEVMAEKEAKIKTLESKVVSLEEKIASNSVARLNNEETTENPADPELSVNEEVKEEEKGDPTSDNRLEAQLREIEKLNNTLDTLRKEFGDLSVEKQTLLETVAQLQSNNKPPEDEKESLTGNVEEDIEIEGEQRSNALENDAEVKKNLVEDLEYKLSAIESRLEFPLSVDNTLSRRLDMLETFYETRYSSETHNFRCKVEYLEKELHSLRSEKDISEENLSKKLLDTIDSLKSQKESLVCENKKIIKDGEDKYDQAIEMQNQMVCDMESLVLGLEADKKALNNEIVILKEEINSIKERYETEFKHEDHLKSVNEISIQTDAFDAEPASKIGDNPSDTERTVEKYENKLRETCEAHAAAMKQLRQDMVEEIDILEQQKEELRLEGESHLAKLANEYAEKLLQCQRDHDLDTMDEKAQFGRVLVSKNDEYEKLSEERKIEADGYQARLKDLQVQLEEKSNMVEELETNIEELVGVRSNLEEALENLKRPKDSSASPSAGSPAFNNLPVVLLSTNVKPPMQN